MKFKLSKQRRIQQAASKQRNWAKIVEYQREYMREWRSREPGKTIVRYANAAYNKKNKLAIAMYRQLTFLAKAEKAFGNGKKARHVRKAWKIAA